MKWEGLLYYERMDGKEEGRLEGRLEELLRQVEIKSAKNKEPEQIADELELTIEEVEELLQILKKE